MSRRRPLSDEERRLWGSIARSIKPLQTARAQGASVAETAAEAETQRPAAGRDNQPDKERNPAPAKAMPPLAPLHRRERQRVSRGRDPIDARIDLHGFTQAQAHAALLRFVTNAQASGARIALVVTGKGTGKTAERREFGVLKRQVPKWLALPQFRPFVVGFEEAHVAHGGEGALYVRLRRIRTND